MSHCADTRSARIATGAIVTIGVAWGLRGWLESSMMLHMLVQLPALALAGAALGMVWLRGRDDSASRRTLAFLQQFNAGGVTGLLAAGFVMVLWMLPRCLDVARLEVQADGLKFATVSAAGLALALSWSRLPVIARAVVHLEAIATLLRFGWGYLAAEDRLCLVYVAGDQQATGRALLWLAAAYAIAIVWRPMFGSLGGVVRHQEAAQRHVDTCMRRAR